MGSRRQFLTTVGAGFAGAVALSAQGRPSGRDANGQPCTGSAALGQGQCNPGGNAGRGNATPVKQLKVKTTPLFKSPEGYPNGIAVAPEGLWICEQKSDNAVLVDWKGKLLKTLKSQ